MEGIPLLVLGALVRVLAEGSESGQADDVKVDQAALAGDISAGIRLTEIHGSEAQFDEDVNQEEGLVLRSVVLRGANLQGIAPVEEFEVHAEGIGDSRSAYRLLAESGPWRTVGKFDRSEFSANAQADLHPFDVEREIGFLGFEYDGGEPGGSRSSLEIESLRRDGITLGSRNFGFEYVTGFPARSEERGYGARGSFLTEIGEFDLDLVLGFKQLDGDERSAFALPSQQFPSETLTEDFDAVRDAHGVFGEARLGRDFCAGRGHVDFGLEWQETDLLGQFDLNETGFLFDPSLPFERDTVGALEFEEQELGGDGGISYVFENDLEASARFTREREEEQGELLRTVILDEQTGDPPSVSQFLDRTTHETSLDLFEIGISTPLGEESELGLTAEWGREEIDVEQVVEEIPIRLFDDSVDQFGGEGTLTVPLGTEVRVEISGGHHQRSTETAEVGVLFTFDEERTSYGALACRWSPSTKTTVSTHVRQELRDSDAFRSEGDLGRYGLSIAASPNERLSFDAIASYQSYDLSSETNLIFFDPAQGFVIVPSIASFESHQHTIAGSARFEATEHLSPRAWFSLASSGGDSEFDYLTASLTIPYVRENGLELGVEASIYHFDGDELLDDSDYDAVVLEFYVRKSFASLPGS